MSEGDEHIEPGVHIKDSGVYIYDRHGEVVSWDVAEFIEDPRLWVAVANALKIFYEHGSHVLRRTIGKPIGPYDALDWLSGRKSYPASEPGELDVSHEDAIKMAVAGFFAQCPAAVSVEWVQRDLAEDDYELNLSISLMIEFKPYTYQCLDGEAIVLDGEVVVVEGGSYDEGVFPPAAEDIFQACDDFSEALLDNQSTLLRAHGIAIIYCDRGGEVQVT